MPSCHAKKTPENSFALYNILHIFRNYKLLVEYKYIPFPHYRDPRESFLRLKSFCELLFVFCVKFFFNFQNDITREDIQSVFMIYRKLTLSCLGTHCMSSAGSTKSQNRLELELALKVIIRLCLARAPFEVYGQVSRISVHVWLNLDLRLLIYIRLLISKLNLIDSLLLNVPSMRPKEQGTWKNLWLNNPITQE